MLTMRFDDMGGYECMTGAWIIEKDGKVMLEVDQRHYGQPNCDYQFHSTECRKVAEACLEVLKGRDYKVEGSWESYRKLLAG